LARQAVAQPVPRRRQHLDVVTLQADLLLQLSIQRLLGTLVTTHAALRELPATPAGTAAEQHLPIVADQHDPDVGAKPFGVDEICHQRDWQPDCRGL
jgi:hypothetical protein